LELERTMKRNVKERTALDRIAWRDTVADLSEGLKGKKFVKTGFFLTITVMSLNQL
jgi:hypothetical protein